MVSTIKHPAYQAVKLLVVQPLDLALRPTGPAILAIDTVGAGDGETVLVVDEGKAARDVLAKGPVPVRSLVVGIIDHVDVTPQEKQ